MKILNLTFVFFLGTVLASGPVLAQETVSATLKTSREGAPIVIDEFSRTADELTVSTDSIGRARFRIEAEIADNEAISEARIRVWPQGQSKPEMDRTVKVVGEYIFYGNTGEDPGTMKVPVNTFIYIPPSATAMEQAVRYAIAVRGDRETVPLTFWSPYQAAEIQEAEVRFPEDGTAELSIYDATYTLSVDGQGNILEGQVQPQGDTIIRE